MPKAHPPVDEYLAKLAHPMKPEIEAVRALILGSTPGVTERVKWNAPSFGLDGEDRVTLRLQPGDRLELIFHRGAKVKDTTGFAFEDGSGLLKWLAPDRAVATVADRADLEAKREALARVAAAWMLATR